MAAEEFSAGVRGPYVFMSTLEIQHSHTPGHQHNMSFSAHIPEVPVSSKPVPPIDWAPVNPSPSFTKHIFPSGPRPIYPEFHDDPISAMEDSNADELQAPPSEVDGGGRLRGSCKNWLVDRLSRILDFC